MYDDKKLAEMLDHSRWQLNNGLVDDMTKNNLFVYGSIVNKEVKGVEVQVDVKEKIVKYDLYLRARELHGPVLGAQEQRSAVR